MPPEDALPECALPTPGSVTPSEVVSDDDSASIYLEALAETRVVVRDEAKEVLKQRIREVEQIRATLHRAEAKLEKLRKKSPEEIASYSPFNGATQFIPKQLRGR